MLNNSQLYIWLFWPIPITRIPYCRKAASHANTAVHFRKRGINHALAYCKAINKRKLFPTDDSAKKVIYLAVQAASKKWTVPIQNWKLALNRFMIEFEDRLADYI